MTHIMIDLETMGSAPTAAITSIGAVLFDPYGNWIGDAFHTHVSLESCLLNGLTMDASTVLWWLGQSEAARKTLVDGQPGASNLREALHALTCFMPFGVTPWCNGASFDFAILNNAYRAIKHPVPPWEYWK